MGVWLATRHPGEHDDVTETTGWGRDVMLLCIWHARNQRRIYAVWGRDAEVSLLNDFMEFEVTRAVLHAGRAVSGDIPKHETLSGWSQFRVFQDGTSGFTLTLSRYCPMGILISQTTASLV